MKVDDYHLMTSTTSSPQGPNSPFTVQLAPTKVVKGRNQKFDVLISSSNPSGEDLWISSIACRIPVGINTADLTQDMISILLHSTHDFSAVIPEGLTDKLYILKLVPTNRVPYCLPRPNTISLGFELPVNPNANAPQVELEVYGGRNVDVNTHSSYLSQYRITTCDPEFSVSNFKCEPSMILPGEPLTLSFEATGGSVVESEFAIQFALGLDLRNLTPKQQQGSNSFYTTLDTSLSSRLPAKTTFQLIHRTSSQGQDQYNNIMDTSVQVVEPEILDFSAYDAAQNKLSNVHMGDPVKLCWVLKLPYNTTFKPSFSLLIGSAQVKSIDLNPTDLVCDHSREDITRYGYSYTLDFERLNDLASSSWASPPQWAVSLKLVAKLSRDNAPANIIVTSEIKDTSFSAYKRLASFISQPNGQQRGPNSYDVFNFTTLALNTFRAELELSSLPEVNTDSLTEQLNRIFGKSDSSASSLLIGTEVVNRGVHGLLATNRSSPGGCLSLPDKFMDDQARVERNHEMLLEIESDLVTIQTNLAKIRTQINSGFQQVDGALKVIFDEIKQMQANIEFKDLTLLIDQNLSTIMNLISSAALIIKSPQAVNTNLTNLAESILNLQAGSFQNVHSVFCNQVVKAQGVNDTTFFDELSVKLNLSDGNLSYTKWLSVFKCYVSKFNFPVIYGSLLICWAVDQAQSENSREWYNKYAAVIGDYFFKLFQTEPGLFLPLSDSGFSVRNLYNNPPSDSDSYALPLSMKFTRSVSSDIISLTNVSDESIEISEIQILSNIVMSDLSRGFWGLIHDLQSPTPSITCEVVTNDQNDPIFACYRIKFANVLLASQKSLEINMSFSSSPENSWTAHYIGGFSVPNVPIVTLINTHGKHTLRCETIAICHGGKQRSIMPPAPSTGNTLPQNRRLVGCFTNYRIYDNFYPSDINFSLINILSYCFAGFDDAGNVFSNDSWADAFNLPLLQSALELYPNLQAELMFGGWSDSANPSKNYTQLFKTICSNPETRSKFAINSVSAMRSIGFTGIGIDWEYPDAEDAENYIFLLTEIKRELISCGLGKYTLSIAAPAGLDKIDNLTPPQWKRLSEVVDYINVMTYDYNGQWSPCSDFNAPLSVSNDHPRHDNIKDASVSSTLYKYISIFNSEDIPTAKLSLGVACYGRGFLLEQGSVDDTNKGLYLPQVNIPPGDTGIYQYKDIVGRSGLPSDIVFQDESPELDLNKVASQSAYCYSKDKNLFISYDSIITLQKKLEFSSSCSLGGVMLWEIYGDSKTQDTSLLQAINRFYLSSPQVISRDS
jgi:GH18 family chitinase